MAPTPSRQRLPPKKLRITEEDSRKNHHITEYFKPVYKKAAPNALDPTIFIECVAAPKKRVNGIVAKTSKQLVGRPKKTPNNNDSMKVGDLSTGSVTHSVVATADKTTSQSTSEIRGNNEKGNLTAVVKNEPITAQMKAPSDHRYVAEQITCPACKHVF